MVKKYFRIWVQLAVMSFKIQTGHVVASGGYLLGKLVRIAFFLLFLASIFKHTQALAGYRMEEVALFFLTFNVIDIIAQLFFRGIYGIRALVREGDFDYFLIQPVQILFRVAFNTVDFLDVVTVIPVLGVTAYVMTRIPHALSLTSLLIYSVLCINGMLIALAIHIAVAALAVWTQELDNTIWIYRDVMTLGRFPVDIYSTVVRQVLIYVVPVAVMVSFPVKGFLHQLKPSDWLLACLMSTSSLALALYFWKEATRHYTSVSS